MPLFMLNREPVFPFFAWGPHYVGSECCVSVNNITHGASWKYVCMYFITVSVTRQNTSFVATKLFLRQIFVATGIILSWQAFVATNTCLSRQNTSFVPTKVCFSRQKYFETGFVETNKHWHWHWWQSLIYIQLNACYAKKKYCIKSTAWVLARVRVKRCASSIAVLTSLDLLSKINAAHCHTLVYSH